jgi:hypothetical protein
MPPPPLPPDALLGGELDELLPQALTPQKDRSSANEATRSGDRWSMSRSDVDGRSRVMIEHLQDRTVSRPVARPRSRTTERY